MNIVVELALSAGSAINLRGRVKFPIGGMASAGRARELDGILDSKTGPVDLVRIQSRQ